MRAANKLIASAEEGLANFKAYTPGCLGGVEDRGAGITYYERQLFRLEADRVWLAHKLGLPLWKAREFA